MQKYGRAFVSAVTAGTVLAGAFMILAFGRGLDGNGEDSRLRPCGWWCAGRSGWCSPARRLGAILHFAPARRQPGLAWLAFAAGDLHAALVAVTLVLGAVFALSSSFGETYGALAGLVALLLWTLLSAVAIFYGAAVAAQLEAVRAGASAPVTTRESAPRGRQRRRRPLPRGALTRRRSVSGSHPRCAHAAATRRGASPDDARAARPARMRSSLLFAVGIQSSSTTSVLSRSIAGGVVSRCSAHSSRREDPGERRVEGHDVELAVVEQRVLVQVGRADRQPPVVDDRRASNARRSDPAARRGGRRSCTRESARLLVSVDQGGNLAARHVCAVVGSGGEQGDDAEVVAGGLRSFSARISTISGDQRN